MRAVVQRRYGSPDDLEIREVDVPVLRHDELLVRVRAASLHPDVWHVVTGRPYVLRLMGAGFVRPSNPVPGTDMSGIVEAVGAGVTRFRPGDAVFGETIRGHQWANGGAYAEFVAVSQELLALKPEHVTFEQAASVPTSGYIALANLRDTRLLAPGRTVLINGAGGGVGSIALQIVKASGARVIAVDSASKLEMLRTLGADEVVDFRQEDFTRRGVQYDLIFDVPADRSFTALRRALKRDGRYVPIGHDRFGASGTRPFGSLPYFVTLMLTSRFVRQLRGPGIPLPSKTVAIAALRQFLEAGTLTPMIDRAYPLSDIREAFRHMIQDEIRGKVVVMV